MSRLRKTEREPKPPFVLKDTDRPFLEKLPAAYQTALILVHTPGTSYERAAIECSAPIGTIKSRVNRARALVLTMRTQAKLGNSVQK